MLPLLGALAGSTLAGSAGLTALTGAAIGSGLGTYAQTGDLGKGILAGLGSYGLGKFTSGMMGADAAAKAGSVSDMGGAGVRLPTPPLAAPPSDAVAALQTDQAFAGMTTDAAGNAVFSEPITTGSSAAPSTPFFDRPARISGLDLPKLGSNEPSNIGEALTAGLSAGTTGESIAFEYPEFKKRKTRFNTKEADPLVRERRRPGDDYDPGKDPEFRYFARNGGLMSLQQGGIVNRKQQGGLAGQISSAIAPVLAQAEGRLGNAVEGTFGGSGSPVDRPGFMPKMPMLPPNMPRPAAPTPSPTASPQPLMPAPTPSPFVRNIPQPIAGLPQLGMAIEQYRRDRPRNLFMNMAEGGQVKNDKQVVEDAIKAVKGQSPSPERALGEFLTRFGEDALKSLVKAVRSGEVDVSAGQAEGTVRGAGDGMEDLVPATLEGEQDVLLSEGEFVVPADVVSGIGNGSTDAGADRLYEMLDRVRDMRTGRKEQAPQIDPAMAMPA